MKDILKAKLERKIAEKIQLATEKLAPTLMEFGGAEVATSSPYHYTEPGNFSNLGVYDEKRMDMKFTTKVKIDSHGVIIPKNTTIRVVRANTSFELVDVFWHPKAGNERGNPEAITASVTITTKQFEEWRVADFLEPLVPNPDDAPVKESIQTFKQFSRLEEDVVKDLRKIVKDKQYANVTFKDKSTFEVDTFTASAVLAVLDNLNPKNKKKMTDHVNKDKRGFLVMVDFAFQNTK